MLRALRSGRPWTAGVGETKGLRLALLALSHTPPRTRWACRIFAAHLRTTAIVEKREKGRRLSVDETQNFFDDGQEDGTTGDNLFDDVASEPSPTAPPSPGGTNSEKFERLYTHLLQFTSPRHPNHLRPKRSEINRLISLAQTGDQVARLLPVLRQWHRKQYGYTGLISEHISQARSDWSRGSTWRLLQGRAIKLGALDSAWNVLTDLTNYGIRPGSSADLVPMSTALIRHRLNAASAEHTDGVDSTAIDTTLERLLLLPAILQSLGINELHPRLSSNIKNAIQRLTTEHQSSPFVAGISSSLNFESGQGSMTSTAPPQPRVRAFSSSARSLAPRISGGTLPGTEPSINSSQAPPSSDLEGSTTLTPHDSILQGTEPVQNLPGYYKVTQTRSPIGLQKDVYANLYSLGLRRRLQTVYRPHNQVEAGKILKVKELVRVDNVTGLAAAEGIASSGPAARRERRKTEKGWSAAGSHRVTPTRSDFERVTGQAVRNFSSLHGSHRSYSTFTTKDRNSAPADTGLSKVFSRQAGMFGRLVQGLLSRENKAKQGAVRPQASSSIFDEAEGRQVSDSKEDLGTEAVSPGQRYAPVAASVHHYRTGNFKGSPQKLGLLAKQISGKHVQDAIEQMQFSPKRKRAHKVRAMLCTARDHAVGYKRMNPARLYIAQAWVGKGLYLKRMEIKGRARTGLRVHPSAHLAVELRLRPTIAESLAREKRLLQKKKVRMPIIEDKPIYNPKPYYNW